MENLLKKYNEIKYMASFFIPSDKLSFIFLKTSDLNKTDILKEINNVLINLLKYLDLGIYIAIIPSYIDLLDSENKNLLRKFLAQKIPTSLLNKVFNEKVLEKI